MSWKSRFLFSVSFLIILCFLKFNTTADIVNGGTERPILKVALKSHVVVIGKTVKLRDLGVVISDNQSLRHDLENVTVSLAPPPGETFEVLLRTVKRSVSEAGYVGLAQQIIGPRVIKVRRAEVEIHKAILQEERG